MSYVLYAKEHEKVIGWIKSGSRIDRLALREVLDTTNRHSSSADMSLAGPP